jgi:hypothetical protein
MTLGSPLVRPAAAGCHGAGRSAPAHGRVCATGRRPTPNALDRGTALEKDEGGCESGASVRPPQFTPAWLSPGHRDFARRHRRQRSLFFRAREVQAPVALNRFWRGRLEASWPASRRLWLAVEWVSLASLIVDGAPPHPHELSSVNRHPRLSSARYQTAFEKNGEVFRRAWPYPFRNGRSVGYVERGASHQPPTWRIGMAAPARPAQGRRGRSSFKSRRARSSNERGRQLSGLIPV